MMVTLCMPAILYPGSGWVAWSATTERAWGHDEQKQMGMQNQTMQARDTSESSREGDDVKDALDFRVASVAVVAEKLSSIQTSNRADKNIVMRARWDLGNFLKIWPAMVAIWGWVLG
ncbi:hypothetical protein C8J57DRAFT_1249478 [Mycena rebaudengoi]|nr:hypothetical protein C8J57DRAFT_1249478 [Mycena rebaudengoi]